MNDTALASAIATQWDEEIVPAITDYIRIPAKSPHFDPQWKANAHIERVIRLAEAWARRVPIHGLWVEIVRLPGRTPLLYFEVPTTRAESSDTVLLYGHLDKQPEMTGWRQGHGPWDPLIEDGKLYGRGSADDGYAVFAALAAIAALQKHDIAAFVELLVEHPAGVAIAAHARDAARLLVAAVSHGAERRDAEGLLFDPGEAHAAHHSVHAVPELGNA
jgi:acetylornithine deacetylase/succinyl-diaminopimelate desuccinylase-like protein